MLYKRSAWLLALLAMACKKTEQLPAESQSRILEYKVANINQGSIFGAIDETDNTVTVYLPMYYNLGVIDPEIKLSPGARLSEAIEPVPVTDSSRVYTVKGSDGSTSTYQLKLIIQQPTITIKEVSTASTPFSYLVRGPINNISGFWYTKDLSVIKPYLVSMKNGTVYPVNTSGTVSVLVSTPDSTGVSMYTLNGAQLPIEMDTGLYKLRVRIYNKVAETSLPVRVSYPAPATALVFQKTWQQGETYILPAQPNSIFRGFQSFKVKVNDSFVPMIIESFSATQAVIRVPADFPPGFYTDFQSAFEGWPVVNSLFNSLTITAK